MDHHHVDKISQLPQPILHRILSSLSQNDAVRTCVLSKSWRYLWLARPNFEFRQTDFPKSSRTTLISALDSSLQRCHDQDLTIQDFFLEIFGFGDDSKSTQLLIKWISTVLQNKGLKTFRLCILWQRVSGVIFQELPPILLKSESLRELHLQGCTFPISNILLLENLQTLSLTRVLIFKATLKIVFSSCPLLENVSLSGCEGFEAINTSSISRLKHLSIEGSGHTQPTDTISIEIDNPTIETITIVACWFDNNHGNYFPNLKSLTLTIVRLSNKSFDFFSSIHMPNLKCLTLDSCYGFKEVNLRLSDSVEQITIRNPKGRNFTKAAIDAPNIVTFVYEAGKINLQSGPVSFSTSSVGWGSRISVSFNDNFNNDPSSWFGKVNEQLGALSGSQISLELFRVKEIEGVVRGRRNWPRGFIDENDQRREALNESLPNIIFCGHDYEPVVVEHLSLRGCYTHSSLVGFLYCLFRICHPRYVGQDLFSNAQSDGERDDKELTVLLFLILITERETREQFWPGGLDDVKMESFDGDNGQGSVVVRFRFRLKWRNRRSC